MKGAHAITIYKLSLILEPQAEGGCVVTSPLLPELITEGETVDGAIRHANDALEALINRRGRAVTYRQVIDTFRRP